MLETCLFEKITEKCLNYFTHCTQHSQAWNCYCRESWEVFTIMFWIRNPQFNCYQPIIYHLSWFSRTRENGIILPWILADLIFNNVISVPHAGREKKTINKLWLNYQDFFGYFFYLRDVEEPWFEDTTVFFPDIV